MFDMKDFEEICTQTNTKKHSLTLTQIQHPNASSSQQLHQFHNQGNNALSKLTSSQQQQPDHNVSNKKEYDKNRNLIKGHKEMQCTVFNHSVDTLRIDRSESNQENVDFKEDQEYTSKLNVRKLSELQEESDANHSEEMKKIVYIEHASVIELSSDDEKDAKMPNTNRQRTKPKPYESATKRMTKRKKKNDNNAPGVLDVEGLKTPMKKPRGRRVSTEEKITVKRTLTKSTNLKTFPAKFLPESQTKIDSFFKIKTDPNRIGYFDTFSQSKALELTEGCAMDCKNVVMDDLRRSKANGRKAVELTGIVDLISEDEKEVEENKDQTKGISQISIKMEKICEDSIKNEHSVCQYYPERKRSLQNPYSIAELNVEKSFSHNMLRANMVTIPFSNLNGAISEDECSSIIFNYHRRAPVERPGSVDYTPPKDRQKIEAGRRANKCSSMSSNSISANVENQRTRHTFRKRLSFKSNHAPEKVLVESSNLNGIKVNVKLNCSVRSNIDRTIPGPSKSQLSYKRTVNTFSSSSSDRIETQSVMLSEKIDTTPDKNSIKKSGVKCTARIKGKININQSKSTGKRRKMNVKCPSYKIIEGTTFAVDAFRFGDIDGVTHYFLTHYHADHYIGLKKSFNKPIFLSEITARLVEAFIHTNPKYLNVMRLNEPIVIKDIEVTALNANHCPGAVMFLFKFPNGMCTLHTGDFRAYPEMEMEPVFWNNRINTIYLDTTYLSRQYAFMSQTESISKVLESVETFRQKHIGVRALYICGSYVIGKEKVWRKMAEENNFKVWTDGNRRKALEVIKDKRILDLLIDDPTEANVHILSLGQLSYDYLSAYLSRYSEHFDVILAIRPSGWERNSKPQFRGRINIIGIEYSEHSSYSELRRFVRFLQPEKLISTVPSGSDLSKTNEIPESWLNNSVRKRTKGYQQSITNFLETNKTKASLSESRNMSDYEMENTEFINSPEGKKRMHAEISTTMQENQYVSEWLKNCVRFWPQTRHCHTNCSATLSGTKDNFSGNNQVTIDNEKDRANIINLSEDVNMANNIRTISERRENFSDENALLESNDNSDISAQVHGEPSESTDWMP